MDRETREFTTPSGKKVVVKTYLTGRESNSVKEGMFKHMKLDVSGAGEPVVSEIPGTLVIEQERTLLSLIVVSLDGKTDGLVEAILDLRNEDYQAIVAEVNKIYQGNLTPAK